MSRYRSPALTVVAASVLLSACVRSAAVPPPEPTEPSRARAALASLFVDNQTTQRLMILYRFANRNAPSVGIGYGAPGVVTELAPVPAGEPLILIARNPAGQETTTGPRTFPLDGSWTWRIERGTRFTPPRGDGR